MSDQQPIAELGLDDLHLELSGVEDLFPLHPTFHVRRIRQWWNFFHGELPGDLHVKKASPREKMVEHCGLPPARFELRNLRK